MSDGYDIARAYRKREIVAWTRELAAQAFDLLGSGHRVYQRFRLTGRTRTTAGRKMMLYDICRKVLGRDTENYPQQVGDCVSFGAKNANEHLQCTQIIGMAKKAGILTANSLLSYGRGKFTPVFPPYYYGTMRVFAGQGRIGREDGGTGAWMAEAVQQYGTLAKNLSGVPEYSGRIARKWGYRPGPPREFVDLAKPHCVKKTALIRSWEDLVDAIINGYPCPTASNVGYGMEPGRDGFHRRGRPWGHQMCFIGVDETYRDPYAIILNNWGDVHGRLQDFQTNDQLPVGVLRVGRRDAEAHIRAGETFAYSCFDDFQENLLDEELFNLL